jgi:hypothetical protein
MKTLTLLLVAAFVVSCGKELPDVQIIVPNQGSNSSAPVSPASVQAPLTAVVTSSSSSSSSSVASSSSSSSSSSSAPSDPPVTYYALTKSATAGNGGTFTATGYVAIFNGVTYLWDNGVITNNHGGFNSYDSFWMLCGTPGTLTRGSGECASTRNDLASSPLIDSGNVSAELDQALASVNTVITTGTESTVNCTESAGILDCGTFTIDTNQSPL